MRRAIQPGENKMHKKCQRNRRGGRIDLGLVRFRKNKETIGREQLIIEDFIDALARPSR